MLGNKIILRVKEREGKGREGKERNWWIQNNVNS